MTNAQMPWPVVSSRGADDGGLGHAGMPDQSRLDFGGRDAVARNVHHVVDAAQHPDVAVGVDACTVTGEVPALLGVPRPVRLLVPLRIAPDAAQHRRPRLIQHQVARHVLGLVGAGHQFLAVFVDDLRRDARQRLHRRTGLGRRDTRQRRDHDRAGLGLPPGVDDRSPVAAEGIPIPAPRLGVDRLTDRAQQSQAGQVMRVGELATPLHEHPDQCGRRVIDCDAVLFDHLESAGARWASSACPRRRPG